uniref:Uncharacterized protein n=1 Tax=Arundo donax TaxID=35708 RepID=A0A0A8Z387_ARUDO
MPHATLHVFALHSKRLAHRVSATIWSFLLPCDLAIGNPIFRSPSPTYSSSRRLASPSEVPGRRAPSHRADPSRVPRRGVPRRSGCAARASALAPPPHLLHRQLRPVPHGLRACSTEVFEKTQPDGRTH